MNLWVWSVLITFKQAQGLINIQWGFCLWMQDSSSISETTFETQTSFKISFARQNDELLFGKQIQIPLDQSCRTWPLLWACFNINWKKWLIWVPLSTCWGIQEGGGRQNRTEWSQLLVQNWCSAILTLKLETSPFCILSKLVDHQHKS